MLNSFQLIDAYRGLAIDQSSQDAHIDVNSLMEQVLAEPEKFGFTNVTDAEMIELAEFQGFTDKFFFWDAVHPTTIAHLMLAKGAVSLLAVKN